MALASRRSVLAGLMLAGACVDPAFAQDEKLTDLKKVFPFLATYLGIPAAERSRFSMAYYLRQDGKPFTGRAFVVDGAQRTPLPIRADGKVERLPTLDQLDRSKIRFDVPPKTKLGVEVQVEPMVALAAEISARELAVSVVQAQAGAKRAAGVMSFAIPKLDEVRFHGVPSGEVVFADGRRALLPVVKGLPVFQPAKQVGAATLRFPKAPAKMLIG